MLFLRLQRCQCLFLHPLGDLRECVEAPLLSLQPRPTCERLELPFSSDDILSGYEDLVSSGSDHFTMWGKMSPREILAEHVVDIHKIEADFRDAFERIQSSSSPDTWRQQVIFLSITYAEEAQLLQLESWAPT